MVRKQPNNQIQIQMYPFPIIPPRNTNYWGAPIGPGSGKGLPPASLVESICRIITSVS